MPINLEANLPDLNQLPATYLVSLSHYSAIALCGEEQSKYLQGQVTCDVTTSSEHNLLVGAHCNAKGKVFSVFRLLNRNSAHLLVQPKASIESSITELKKYGVFAKVEISQTDELQFIAFVGENAVKSGSMAIKTHHHTIEHIRIRILDKKACLFVCVKNTQNREVYLF